jgi:hypothetical protein
LTPDADGDAAALSLAEGFDVADELAVVAGGVTSTV